MHTVELGDQTIAYYDEEDLAPCRACGVAPVYNDGRSNGGSCSVRCPSCGIKTGTSTSGLEGVLPAWNAVMDGGWPQSDPKGAVL